jgi:hypothetical protein
MRTVVGVFSNEDEAKHVVGHLIEAGVPSDDIAVADALHAEGHEYSERNLAACGGMAPGWFMAWLVPLIAKRTFPAAVAFGATVGGVAGFVAGLVALRAGSPASLPVTLLAGVAVGAIFGAVIAGIYNMGVTHEEIALKDEAVREHGVVVAAHVDEVTADAACQLMEEHGARALRTEADVWKATGWTGTVVPDEPYPSDSTIRKHAA